MSITDSRTNLSLRQRLDLPLCLHAVNLAVQRQMSWRRLFVRNNGSNGTTLRKRTFLRGPDAQWSWTQGGAKIFTLFLNLLFCGRFDYISLA